MIIRENRRDGTLSGGKLQGLLLALLAMMQPAANAQSTYRTTSGGYLHVAVAESPVSYDAGYSFNTAAWPLLEYFSTTNSIQSRLYGTWLAPLKTVANDDYTMARSRAGLVDRPKFPNLMEFTLGGAPMATKQRILSTLTKRAGAWVFTYERSDASRPPATVQAVEYGNDLAGWTSVPISATAEDFVTIVLGSPTDRVSVPIPSVGPRTFVRLKVTRQ